jgi:hypothetical protein
MFKDDHSRQMVIDYLEQVQYWQSRFELSGDIDHLNTAERHAKVAKSYLPPVFQDLSIIALCNLYLIIFPHLSKLLEEKCF